MELNNENVNKNHVNMDNRRLLVTGDMHGDRWRMLRILEQLKQGDVLFQTGDFGYLFRNTTDEYQFFYDMEELLEAKDGYLIFVDGNHENHAALNSYPVAEWCGAKVHRLQARIMHVMRGEILTICDRKIYCFGGAFSIDREYRELNRSYWAEELPEDSDYRNGNHNLKKVEYKVDYILSHTCPLSTAYILRGDHRCLAEEPLQNYFEWVRTEVDHRMWYFGHWHVDQRLGEKQRALFYDVVDMETGEVIQDC